MINIGTASGGGAIGAYAYRTIMGLHNSGFPFEMGGGSSTGTIAFYMYCKQFFDEGAKLYPDTYDQFARNIFEPGLAKLDQGKIKINWFKALPKVFNIKSVHSLMTNKGLYEIFLALEKKQPNTPVPMFFNTVSLKTGKGSQHALSDFPTPELRAAALTTSCSIPGIFPLRSFGEFELCGDGGITDGLPFRQMFMRMQPGKDYQFFNIMCNPLELMPADQLTNIAQIIGRTVSIMLLEILKGDLERTVDRNEIAKIIWPITDRLEKLIPVIEALEDGLAADVLHTELTEAIRILRETLGYRHMPIHNLVYPDHRGVFEFTPESYHEQIASADKLVSQTVALLQSTPVAPLPV